MSDNVISNISTNDSCPITGLEIKRNVDWLICSDDGSYRAEFSVIGNHIVHSVIHGFTSIDISKRYLDLLDNIIDTTTRHNNEKMILVENYREHSGTSKEARNYYLERQKKNHRLQAVIYYEVSSLFAMMIRVGRVFAGFPFPVEIASNYEAAILLAVSLDSRKGKFLTTDKSYFSKEEIEKEINGLIQFLGLINWKDHGLPDEPIKEINREAKLFRPIYDALTILKNDYDEIEQQKGVAQTKQREMQEQLHHVERMQTIGTLTGGIAHDLNNMMSAITGFAALLQKRYGITDSSIDKYANMILDTGNRASDLIQKLLSFARKGKIEKTELTIGSVFDDLSVLLQHTANKKVSIEYSIHNPEICLMGDKVQIQNAMLNLAINAIDAMPEGGQLSFCTREISIGEEAIKDFILAPASGKYIEISVSDTGCGIPCEIAPHIFEPFFTTKAADKGTGLGLANVLGMVKNHYGGLKFISEMGVGTTFYIFLKVI